MFARIVRKEISFHTRNSFIHCPPVPEGKDPLAEQLFIACGADAAIRKMLKQKYVLPEQKEAAPDPETPDTAENALLDADETPTPPDGNNSWSERAPEPPQNDADKAAAKLVAFLDEKYLCKVPHFPQRLGRVSSHVHGPRLHTHEESCPLTLQLEILKQRNPGKHHFRIALINGLGGAHGDCLLGMTALRVIGGKIEEHLPSFSFDILYGPESRPGNIALLTQEPHIEQVLFQELHMGDFAAYDAYFDLTGLILLPRYNELPAIDFTLWWFGLNPEEVPASQKRNQASIFWKDWQAVGEVLRALPSEQRKLIFFNPKASCRVRSIPSPQAERLLLQLAEESAEYHFVIDQKMDVAHPRISCVADHINSVERFKALVALVDGFIGVDSFGPHFADVTATPSVQLCSVLPKSFYPYYPYNTVVELEGMDTFPAFRKVKDNTDEEWEAWKDTYTAAWEKLNSAELLQCLADNMQKRAAAQGEPRGMTLIHALENPSCVKETKSQTFYRRDKVTHLWEPTQLRMANLCARILKLGSVAVLAGPGQTALAEMMARQCGPKGMVHLFEPRAYRAALIGGDLARKSLFGVTLHQHALGSATGTREILRHDPWSESDPYQWGNVPHSMIVPAVPLDSLNLQFCHLLLIQPPFEPLNVLLGAEETLERCKPILICGPLPVQEVGKLTIHPCVQSYDFWVKQVIDDKIEQVLLLGVPKSENCRVEGFIRVEHKK